MDYNGHGVEKTGEEPISSMWVEDKRKLCNILDARHLWKDLASQRDFNFSQDEVILFAQAERARYSPTECLLNAIYEKKRTTMLELYNYLKQAHLLSAMNIVKKYVPAEYHSAMERKPLALVDNSNPIGLEPKPPPPLHIASGNQPPMHLMDFVQPELTSASDSMPSLADGPMSSLPALTSTQLRAAHTMMTTRNFPIEDILRATDNFSEKYLIAQSSTSSIYHVELEHTTFAAKVYDASYNAVLSDLQVTRHHSHENIVPITGKCVTSDKVIVLYEFMTNGSLRTQLDKGGILTMDQRANILLGAARGLQYLHSNKPPLLHRNIKSKNILLNDGLRARLSDFGLAAHVNKTDSESSVYTHFSTKLDTSIIQSNRGYNAREVLDNLRFSTKSDTFAFGVVIFEACTGLPPVDVTKKIADQELANYIDSIVQGSEDAWKLRDQTIRWQEKTYCSLFMLGQKCTNDSARYRPSMHQVYETLDQIVTGIYEPEEPEQQQAQEHPQSRPEDLAWQQHISSLAGPATFHGYNLAMHLPPEGHYYPGPHGQSLPIPGDLHAFYADARRMPIESQISHASCSGESQPSVTSSTLSDLDITSLQTPAPQGTSSPPPLNVGSVPSHVATTPPPDASSAAPLRETSTEDSGNMVERETAEEHHTYIENPTPIATADFSEMGDSLASGSVDDSLLSESQDEESIDTAVDLHTYLEPDTNTDSLTGDEDSQERGAELDPELLDVLEQLSLNSSA